MVSDRSHSKYRKQPVDYTIATDIFCHFVILFLSLSRAEEFGSIIMHTVKYLILRIVLTLEPWFSQFQVVYCTDFCQQPRNKSQWVVGRSFPALAAWTGLRSTTGACWPWMNPERLRSAPGGRGRPIGAGGTGGKWCAEDETM